MKAGLRFTLVVSLLLLVTLVPGTAASAQTADSASSVTVEQGPFTGLKVMVSQTTSLINQVVKITWTGIPVTPGGSGSLAPTDFMQIMECWGDPAAGPKPSQCQFGIGDATQYQYNTGSRQLLNARATDPAIVPPIPLSADKNTLPFWPAGQPEPVDLTDSTGVLLNPFLDKQITNEIPIARTRADGGEAFFEVQTQKQSAGLNCGKAIVVAGSPTTGQPCWLVLVPRNSTEVDGQAVAALESSPLSPSNWQNRVQIRLDFLPVDQSCPLGVAERAVLGHEPVVDAISSWQPALCSNGGATYGYTQLTDDLARGQALESASPGLSVVTNPVAPDQVPPDRKLVYAPVALSALAIGFVVDHAPGLNVQDPLAGARFTEMKLTPRLVAKLLTQTYYFSISGDETSRGPIAKNPLSLTDDKEFLKYNPDYASRARPLANDALVQLSTADTTAQLWTWILGDADARAFLGGAADEWGTIVNPKNQGLATPPSSFPRNDDSCVPLVLGQGAIGKDCTLDGHPYANDMHTAGRAISRGDSLGKVPSSLVENTDIIKYASVARQPIGGRALLAVVDTATAARYGLQTAMLSPASSQLNPPAREFVAPSTSSLLTSLTGMKAGDVPGVLLPDPVTQLLGAYPMASLSEAVIAPAKIDKAAGKDYADLVRYAVGAGQQPGPAPGQLPTGYAPLPEALRAQALAAASEIEAKAGIPITPAGQESADGDSSQAEVGTSGSNTAGTGDVSSNGDSPADASNTGAGLSSDSLASDPVVSGGVAGDFSVGGQIPAGSPPALAAPPQPGAGANSAVPTVVASRQIPTPATPTPAVGALLVALLVTGGTAGALAPVALSYSRGAGPGGGMPDVRALLASLVKRKGRA